MIAFYDKLETNIFRVIHYFLLIYFILTLNLKVLVISFKYEEKISVEARIGQKKISRFNGC